MLDSVVFGAQTCRLGGLGAPFWHPGVPFWGYGGPVGHPIGHLWVQTSIFIDLGWIWDASAWSVDVICELMYFLMCLFVILCMAMINSWQSLITDVQFLIDMLPLAL